jgi:hypothetical protein
MALDQGKLNLVRSCFENGNATYVVFVDYRSTYEESMNYINNFVSEQCPDTQNQGRLFMENPGSGCFLGSPVCEGTCMQVADQIECQAILQPTQAPFPGMTNPPTSVPTPAVPVPTSFPTPLVASDFPTMAIPLPTYSPNSEAPTGKARPTTPPLSSVPTIPSAKKAKGKVKAAKKVKGAKMPTKVIKGSKVKVPKVPKLPTSGLGKGKGGLVYTAAPSQENQGLQTMEGIYIATSQENQTIHHVSDFTTLAHVHVAHHHHPSPRPLDAAVSQVPTTLPSELQAQRRRRRR